MSTALISPTPPIDQHEHVENIFSQVKEHIGFVPDGLRLYGISPPLLESFVGNVGYFRGGTSLSGELTAMIRYLVSDQAKCKFCIDMNEGFLDSMGVDLEKVRAARSDIEQAPLSEKEKSLLRLALSSVDLAKHSQATEVEAARQAGWGDREIFDAVVQAAANRAFNHVLRTFNVEQQGAFV